MRLLTDLDKFIACARGKDVFFYGAGGGGLSLLQTARECDDRFRISGFLDTCKHGTLADLPVIPIDSYNHDPEKNVIVIASHYWKEISDLLKERDIHDFLSAPPFWNSGYMFSRKDRERRREEIAAITGMLADEADRKLFQYLIEARTHGSSLAKLHLDLKNDAITLRFTDTDFLRRNFPGHTDRQYLDFIIPDSIQVVVQAGVFNGMDILNLAQLAPHFQKAYGFEPSGDVYFLPPLKELALKGTFVHETLALWHKNTTLAFFPSQAGSFVSDSVPPASDAGTVQAITLDEYCANHEVNRVDFICCDIEGAEINFLRGAEKTIVQNRPQMAISIYHSKKQFLEVPIFFRDRLENYTFKLGHYGKDLNETTLYAIPEEIYETNKRKIRQEHYEN